VTATYHTSPCILNNATYLQPRIEALGCIRRYADFEPEFGVLNSGWEEYNPTCTAIDPSQPHATFMLLAEPANARSSTRGFDSLACPDHSTFLAESGAQLGIGSFAFHGSGNPSPGAMGDMDIFGMDCAVGSLLLQGLKVTGTSTTVIMSGSHYDLDALVGNCVPAVKQAMSDCLTDDQATFSSNLKSTMSGLRGHFPPFTPMIELLIAWGLQICLPPAIVDAIAAIFVVTGISTAESMEAALAYSIASTPAVSWRDWIPFNSNAICWPMAEAVVDFIRGLTFQGESIGVREAHHRWHILTGSALDYGALAVTNVEKRLAQPRGEEL